MCFTRLNLKPPKIAEKSIVCYKLLRKQGNKVISPFRKKPIWKGKKIKKVKVYFDNTRYFVDQGFHSFIELKNAKAYGKGMINKEEIYIYKFIIPKGAKYHKNKTQYVSNKIRLAAKTPIQPLLKKK